ncbi:MAG: AAA family ATPase, partial [Longimicrobiales bacterium]|nr:AAA family ATPase [Longimicrobiales bacterium]
DRGPELARLGHFLDRALEGHGTVAFVTGEAGTGKTVLSREFCARSLATHSDLVSATGDCDSHTGIGDPYHPFCGILSLLTGDVKAHWMAGSMSTTQAERLWSLLPITTGAIIDCGPDLLDTFVRSKALAVRASAYGPAGAHFEPMINGLPSRKDETSPRTKQATLFEQYSEVLRTVAEDRPLLLVLEDLQWADSGSLDLLFHLGRHLEGTRILLLGLYRPTEIFLGRNGDRHPLVKVANEFRRTLGDVEVTLAENEDRAFLEAVIDSEPNALGKDFRDALFQRTLGHALFTFEFLRGLQDEGRIRPDKRGRWVEGPDLNWDRLPVKIEAIIEERTSRLPEILRRILTAASVEGEQFTLEVVAKVLGEDPMRLIPLVSGDLEKRHRLVQIEGVERSDGQRLSVFRFRHILFQEFLYGRLDEAEKAYFHEKTGRAMEELHGSQMERWALPLARHFREAGLIKEAVGHLQVAANRARGAAAYRECATLLKEAWSLISTLPESLDRDTQELAFLSKFSTISWSLGMLDEESNRALSRLKDLAGRLGDDDSSFWVLVCEFSLHHFAGEQEKGRLALDEAETVADRTQNPSQRVQLEGFRGLNRLNLGEPLRAVKDIARFEALYDPDRDATHMGYWIPNPVPLFRALKALALG